MLQDHSQRNVYVVQSSFCEVYFFTFLVFIFVLLRMHAGPKRLAASSWSADIGVGTPYHSPGLHHCGGGSRKSQSYLSPQQRKSQGDRGGRLMHVTSNSPFVNYLISPNKHGHREFLYLKVNFVAKSIRLMFQNSLL